MSFKNITTFILSIAAATTFVGVAHAAPSGFEIQTVVSGLNLATDFEYAPDGRIFFAEKSGTVRIFKEGALLPTPFITLTDVNDYWDRGLVGIALDPNFDTNGYVYLAYTYENDASNYSGPKTARVVRVTADGDVALAASELVLVGTEGGDSVRPSCEDFIANTDCIPSDSPSHSIDALEFGPDNMLYVSIGDSASFDVVDVLAHRASDITSFAGKVLRIDPATGEGLTTNPHYTGDVNDNASKVYAQGFRNPFRIAFRPLTDTLYVGDVGWYSTEEINVITPGEDYGWPCREGLVANPGGYPASGFSCGSASSYEDPMYDYAHDPITGAGSITAGRFYTGSSYPSEYVDTFFIGDFAQDWIKRVVVDGSDNLISVEDFHDGAGGAVSFGADLNGDINYISIYTGELRRIAYTGGNVAPNAVAAADVTSGITPLNVFFNSNGSSDPDGDPISFSWDFGDGSPASSISNPSHTYTSNGTYQVTLTVTDSSGATDQDSIDITVGNTAPTAIIALPSNGDLYAPLANIELLAIGNDPEDGVINDDLSFNWTVLIHHNVHYHTLQTMTGQNPTLLAPTHGDDDETVHLEVQLTVTDSGGLVSEMDSVRLYIDSNAGLNPAHINSVVNPVGSVPGTPISITSTITNSGDSGTALVDIELFNSLNQQVAQVFFDEATLDQGVPTDFVLNYTPTVADTYRVAVGIIENGWGGLYEWTNNALTFVIDDGTGTTTSWTPTPPNGGMYFDGVDDFIDTEYWDIEEPIGFSLEARFAAESFNGDTAFIGKSDGVVGSPNIDWMFGLREISPALAELVFIVTSGGTQETVTGGTVALGEFVHASAVYDNADLILYKNGVEIARTPKTGLIAQDITHQVLVGNLPGATTTHGFHGTFDEVRVWNEPQTAEEIFAFQGELTQKEDGLIKDWRFNEGFGQVVIDRSNSGHHGHLGSIQYGVDVNDPVFLGGVYPAGGTFAPEHSVTTALPNPVSPGSPTTISVDVENTGTGAGFIILNVEVYDDTETQVFQDFVDGEGFFAGETRTFDFEFTPATEGDYRVAVGVVHLFWADVYEWVNDAMTLTVASGANSQPVISLLGDNPLNLTEEDPYADPGATATDAEDGDLTSSIVVGGDVVDPNTVGTYNVTYNVTDSGGLAATEVVRVVNVNAAGGGNVAPTITLVGDNPLAITTGGVYTDPGATASDPEDGDITGSIVVGGDTVDVNTPATYVVTYNVIDSGGLAAPEVTRDVVVSDPVGGPFGLSFTSAAAAPSTVATGETANFSATITNTGDAGTGVINLEVYEGGVQVHQEVFEDEAFTAGQARTFDFDYIPASEGTYSLQVGLYEQFWAGFFGWTSDAAVLTVDNGGGGGTSTPGHSLYTDGLEPGYDSWSWGVSADFNSTAVTSSEGSESIEVNYTGGWGGLYLSGPWTDVTPYTDLVFDIHGGVTGGQELRIIGLDDSYAGQGEVLLSSYATPSAGGWTTVTIPLADIGLSGATMTGIIFQDANGTLELTFYLDAIRVE